jgi:hypothetical protein
MGQALSILTGVPATISMMTMMASLEAAVTRTPIGTCIIVLQVRRVLFCYAIPRC